MKDAIMEFVKSMIYSALFLIGLGFVMRVAAFFFMLGWGLI